MALIKCIECGKEFSDKAYACPNCGAPTSFSDGHNEDDESENNSLEIICKECGNLVDENETVCKHCGNPLQNHEVNPTVNEIVWFIVIILGIVASVYIYTTTVQKDNAINLVKNYERSYYDTIDEQVKDWVNNRSDVVSIYGWEATKVSEGTYFVAFAFDKDYVRNNGYSVFCYEAELKSGMVREINGNSTLEEKYRDLNLME